METFSEASFRELAAFRGAPAFSAYLPTHRAGAEVNEMQDALRFKSMLQEVRKSAPSEEKEETEQALRAGFGLLEQEDLWRNLEEGLAVFMAPDYFRAVKIPLPVPREMFRGPHFHILPLFPLLKSKPFFLLTLSKGGSGFYRGHTFGLGEMKVKGLPYGIDDVVRFEEKGGRETFRRGGGKGMAAFHGHGPGLAEENEYLARYLKEVDQTLMSDVLSREKAPLVVAAVDYLASMYRQVSRYRYVYPEHLAGNYEREDLAGLFEKAGEILQPYFTEDTRKALENYFDHSATSLSSDQPEEVIPACFYGKVADLFVAEGAHLRGSFDRETGEIRIANDDKGECLLNSGAAEVYRSNGNVYLLDRGQMPGGSKLAAFMRYE